MAILNGIIKKMTGSAGQQRQRMKWVNIIRMYSGIAPLLKNGKRIKLTKGDFLLPKSLHRKMISDCSLAM